MSNGKPAGADKKVAAGVVGLIGLIEGIIYLTKSDEEFVNTYINNKRGWF